MMEEELLNVWRNSAHSNQIKVNLPLLVAELRHKMEKIDRQINSRDRREIIACLIGMMGFAYLAYDIPFMLTKMACLLTISWFGYVIYRLMHTSKDREPDASLSLYDQLEARKTYLRKQARLLDTVLYWYIIPPFFINALFLFGIGEPGVWDSPLAFLLPYEFLQKLSCLGFIVLMYTYITWMNRKASRKYFPPLISEIERTQQELRSSE